MDNNYDEFAFWYDLVLGNWNLTVKNYERSLSKYLDIDEVELGIDVACGTGVYLAALARLLPRAIGIDISAGMLDKARMNMAIETTQWELVQAPWDKMPLEDDSNVIIVCGGNSIASCTNDSMLSHVLSEFRRVVGDGQVYIDARNLKSMCNYGMPRIRGKGTIDGIDYFVYDTISLNDDNTYEVKITIKERKEGFDDQNIVFETSLIYRKAIKDAIVRMAPDIGFSVDRCFITNDLGEAFDTIIMSATGIP